MNRRKFLTGTAAALAVASLKPAFAAKNISVLRTNTAAAIRPRFHSRHIPIELLNLQTPKGREVVRNGLCDTIKPDVLKRLRDLGVELVEMRFVWWEIEPESGRFDWTRALRDMDAVLNAGLKIGMFAWFQYPPTWYDPERTAHARLHAVGSNEESTVLSLWDPKTIEVYDRLLGISADTLKGRLSFVYNAISGSYGEVEYGLAANHYKFSSPIGRYLLGDRCARASFAKELERKYGSVDALNKAWGSKARSFDDDLIPKLPFENNSLQQRDDCMQWSTGSVLDFADSVCGLYKKHFPGIPGALPLGFVQEQISVGQIKSRAAKLAAKHGLTSRWTGCAVLGTFGRSNLLARRIASAAHFYRSPFGTEAALTLEAGNAANGLYESFANGASLIHDDPENIFRAIEVHKNLRSTLIVDPPKTSTVVFYPVEDNLLQIDGFSWETLINRCAELRRVTDYDVCDSYMIRDGYLKGKRDLFLLVNSHLREDTARAAVEFAATSGRIWFFGDSQVAILHQPTTLDEMAAKRGLKVLGPDQVEPTGMYRFTDWRETVPHVVRDVFRIPDDGQEHYRAMHWSHESCYFPSKQRFEIRERDNS